MDLGFRGEVAEFYHPYRHGYPSNSGRVDARMAVFKSASFWACSGLSASRSGRRPAGTTGRKAGWWPTSAAEPVS